MLHDLEYMPSGINTDVGENGATLSGGQKKRIHLSRAMYKKTDIYLFDNPLSALDPKVQVKVARAILETNPGKTKIIFSNTTLYWEGVDIVYVLRDG